MANKEVYMELMDNRGDRSNKKMLERCFRLLEYLRKNTDKDHPTIQARLRESELKPILGTNETFNKTVSQLAEALNYDKHGVKPEDEWVLVYKAFRDFYGENGDDADEMSSSVKDIYFNHIFTNDEVTAIINALRTTKAVSRERAENIIKKLKNRLTSKYYQEPSYKLNSCEFTDTPRLSENLEIIQEAISDRKMLEFTFNYYGANGKLTPCNCHSVSPHYIVVNNGRFYLWCSFNKFNNSWVFRIDLMTGVRISVYNKKPLPAEDTAHIRDLPPEMSDEFKVKHLYMSYETPLTVKLKNTKTLSDDELTYTFIHDTFGSNFTVIDEKEGIVRVRCSEFGIINFALEYNDCVEILDPPELREKIAERVKQLNEKYL